MSAELRQGTVTAVCMSPDHGYPTYPQESVYVGPLGIEGDAHSGPDRESAKIQEQESQMIDQLVSLVKSYIKR